MTPTNHTPPELQKFFAAGTSLRYKKGQIIIRPEDEPSGVFFIDSGYVKTYSVNKYGSENLHLVRKPGEIFPFIWVFTKEHREVYYEAMNDAHLYRVARSNFLKEINSNQEMMNYILLQAVEMYRIHSERLYNIQFHTAEERVVYRLDTLSRRFGVKRSDGSILIELPLRHSDISASLRMSRETATRILSKLEKKGLIGYEKPYIVLLDPKKLSDLI